jgi:hypothetical protein
MLKVLSSEKRDELKVVSVDRSHSKLFTLRPHPVRGLKLLNKARFYYLNTIIVFNDAVLRIHDILVWIR